MQLACPHCNGISDVPTDQPLADRVCLHCGRSFGVASDESLAYETQSGTLRRRTVFGRFELLEKLGSGAFGAVWKARDTQLDRIVALKLPRHGQLPFRGKYLMVLKQVREDEPPSLRKLDRKVPRDLETVCLKCLEKDPAKRYATAHALAEDLEQHLRGEPVLARPVGRPRGKFMALVPPESGGGRLVPGLAGGTGVLRKCDRALRRPPEPQRGCHGGHRGDMGQCGKPVGQCGKPKANSLATRQFDRR